MTSIAKRQVVNQILQGKKPPYVPWSISLTLEAQEKLQQHGLQMGHANWREFILPELKRMYGTVRKAGKHVFIHSCGDVDELFDDLVDAGLNCFNPFQPGYP
jgi:hypothetical protein